ncbi:MAG: nitronate monooxygenase [Acidimicrobiales bacterium]|nr:nitronate monooxygenase [Acidimicrobiales bacterium]
MSLTAELSNEFQSKAVATDLPKIIQGGMGVGISRWQLARAVGQLGCLGVVSGTAIEVVHARTLGLGDPGGHLQRAYANFPDQELVQRVLGRWYIKGGKSPKARFKSVPMFKVESSKWLLELTVLANFGEVWLAKEDNPSPVGINYLEKIHIPTAPSIYGAILGGVDAVTMGAGIPAKIPDLIRSLSRGKPVSYSVPVEGSDSEFARVNFDPSKIVSTSPKNLRMPAFLAIVSSHVLAIYLAKDQETIPDGFIVEAPSAGGHNAPPRGRLSLDDAGQPIYGERDNPDLKKIKELGLPFWLAGTRASPEAIAESLEQGARGVQIGTAFALCKESGMEPDLRHKLFMKAVEGDLTVMTDPVASPSGYPFKVANMEGTLSEDEVLNARDRKCDLGYLRVLARAESGVLVMRCPSEEEQLYIAKGGAIENTVGRKCLCNGLLATAGFAQTREISGGTYVEPPIVTIGDDVVRIAKTIGGETDSDGNGEVYCASDLVKYLLSQPNQEK